MTVIELVALVCGILGFLAGVFSALTFYAHTIGHHTSL